MNTKEMRKLLMGMTEALRTLTTAVNDLKIDNWSTTKKTLGKKKHERSQTITVHDYQQFEKLVNRVEGPPDEDTTSLIASGLREEIKLDVQLKKPTGLVAPTVGRQWTEMQKLSIRHDEVGKTKDEHPAVLFAEHLQVTNANCSLLSLGSFRFGVGVGFSIPDVHTILNGKQEPISTTYSLQQETQPMPTKYSSGMSSGSVFVISLPETLKSENGTELIHCNRKLIGAKYFNTGYKAAAGKLNESFYSTTDHAGLDDEEYSKMKRQLVFLSFLRCFLSVNGGIDLQTYIVHVLPSENNSLSANENGLEEYYKSFMPDTAVKDQSSSSTSSFVHSYEEVVCGFAARMTAEELKEMEKKEGFLYAYRDRVIPLLITYTPDFLGLRVGSDLWKEGSNMGEWVIIGVHDSGYSPEHPSFNDDGMPTPPSKWKGGCEAENLCNNKVIGVKTFVSSFFSVPGNGSASYKDEVVHGTHTLSTAGGKFVPNASVFGYGNCTTKGGSPNARVADYKVCWKPVNDIDCLDADVLVGFEAAIDDRVDVLTVLLGGTRTDYFNDRISIGAFHAVKKGIMVFCSGTDSGPEAGAVSNVAPWIVTVGANIMDKEFLSYALLGNDTRLKRESLPDILLQEDTFYHCVSSVDSTIANSTEDDAQLCVLGSLEPNKAKGKVMACLRGTNGRIEKGEEVRLAEGIGLVLANNKATGNEILADTHVLPVAHISKPTTVTGRVKKVGTSPARCTVRVVPPLGVMVKLGVVDQERSFEVWFQELTKVELEIYSQPHWNNSPHVASGWFRGTSVSRVGKVEHQARTCSSGGLNRTVGRSRCLTDDVGGSRRLKASFLAGAADQVAVTNRDDV